MSSSRRNEANKRNAQKSTGPRTAAGKSRSSRNALKHGLLATSAVFPDEDPAVFAAHSDALFETLRPRGALEEMLAGRIIDLFWRLARCSRIESALISYEQLCQRAASASKKAQELELEANEELTSSSLATLAGTEPEPPTIRNAKKLLRTNLFDAWQQAKEALATADAELGTEVAKLAAAYVAGQGTLANLSRYETALHRNLMAALHELQRVQAVRIGDAAQAPLAVDVGISVADRP